MVDGAGTPWIEEYDQVLRPTWTPALIYVLSEVFLWLTLVICQLAQPISWGFVTPWKPFSKGGNGKTKKGKAKGGRGSAQCPAKSWKQAEFEVICNANTAESIALAHFCNR